MAKILIIGGGFAGCCAAHMLREHDVTLVERADVLGGGCRTLWYGGHPYTIGPRHFLTKRADVWDYLHAHCPMKRYAGHEFLSYVEGDESFYHFPIHIEEVATMPGAARIALELRECADAEGARNLEEYWINSIGPTLYGKFIDGYSRKMWGGEASASITDFAFTPKGVALQRGPIKAAWADVLCGFPKSSNGYNNYFGVATERANVRLSAQVDRYDVRHRRVCIAGEWSQWDMIVSTISPEDIFNGVLGPLRWMGRDFLKVVLPVRAAFPDNVYFLYYPGAEQFTRIVEYKKFYDYESPQTLLGIEIPSTSNKLYPYPMQADQDAAQRYLDMLPANVYSIGRMGSYRYLDMGATIEQCLELKGKI